MLKPDLAVVAVLLFFPIGRQCLLSGQGTPIGAVPGGINRAKSGSSFQLPCHPDLIAPSGDGSTVWVACFDPLKARPGESSPRWTSRNFRPTTVYAVSVPSGNVTQLFRSAGFTRIAAAPVGNRVVFVSNGESRKDEAVLYEGQNRVASLPINPWYFVWGADGKRLLVTVETPRDADAWWGVGVLNLQDFKIARKDLLEPTESPFVCPATGHVFTGFTDFRSGLRPERAVEYDSDVTHPRRLEEFPPGHFSADCKYVATTESYHGPIPWGVFEVSTGRKMIEENLTGEGPNDEYGPHSWNPRREEILLRNVYRAQNPGVQVFDVLRQEALAFFPVSEEEVAWAPDGASLIISRGNSLFFEATPSNRQ